MVAHKLIKIKNNLTIQIKIGKKKGEKKSQKKN